MMPMKSLTSNALPDFLKPIVEGDFALYPCSERGCAIEDGGEIDEELKRMSGTIKRKTDYTTSPPTIGAPDTYRVQRLKHKPQSDRRAMANIRVLGALAAQDTALANLASKLRRA